MNTDRTNPLGTPITERLTVNEFCRTFKLSRTKFYDLLKRGELQRRKCGWKTLIDVEEANRWWKSLPTE